MFNGTNVVVFCISKHAIALRYQMYRKCIWEKVCYRSQILERPSIGEYWNISGLPVLPENVILTFFRTCWCYSEAYNTGTLKWSSIVQYSCTNIWDLKAYLFLYLQPSMKVCIQKHYLKLFITKGTCCIISVLISSKLYPTLRMDVMSLHILC